MSDLPKLHGVRATRDSGCRGADGEGRTFHASLDEARQDVAVPFDVSALGPSVRDRDDEWASLGLAWTVGPTHPSHGKALIQATFEGADLFAEILLWDTGEAELETVRVGDGRIVNKHYDLGAVADVDVVLAELIALARDGAIPSDAVTGNVSDRDSTTGKAP